MTKVQSWEVEVRVNGDSVLTIGGEGAAHIAGIENIDDYARTVETCAHHLLAFIGWPVGLGEPQSPTQQADDLEDAAKAVFDVICPGVPYTAEDAFWYRQAARAALAVTRPDRKSKNG